MIDYSTAFTRGLPHGILAAVHLPKTPYDLPDQVLQKLHDDEQAHAATLSPLRCREWVGGRLAARVAASALGFTLGPLLPDAFGAPQGPKALSVSISHKGNLAVALVAKRSQGDVGVDLEHIGRDRAQIASKILVPRELEEIKDLPPDRKWNAILTRFALKEATYKALAPTLRRYVGFHEAEVSSVANGKAVIQLSLKEGTPPKSIAGRYDWIQQDILTTVQVRWI